MSERMMSATNSALSPNAPKILPVLVPAIKSKKELILTFGF